MARFRYEGTEYELVAEPLVPEIAMAERAAKMGVNEFTFMERAQMQVWISLRRAGVMLTWAECMQIPPGRFEEIEDSESDPTSAAPSLEAVSGEAEATGEASTT